MAVSAAYFSTSACSPPLSPLRVSSFPSSPPPPHGGPSSSKPDKARSFASITLMAGGVGVALVTSALVAPSTAAEALAVFKEPTNALSLPTWAIHVSSVVEWVTAMALVWEYGEKLGFEAWKGLSWGMVPLLGGALCACTWHFFYNSEALEVLVALQAGLTVIGNMTMCFAAFRIFRASQGGSKSS